MQRKPNFFIVGAPKCGTSAMYEYVSQHPDVYMSAVKEPYFFGDDLIYLNKRRIPIDRDNLDQYLSLFQSANGERILGEASVTYLVSKNAASEIYAFNPTAKILIMLRNPVEMIYALHSQLRYVDVESERNFVKALRLEESRKQGEGIPPTIEIVNFLFYRKMGSYYNQVKRYLAIFPSEQVKVVIYDHFKRDTAQSYREVLEYLGVDATYQPDSFARHNSNRIRRNDWLRNLIKREKVRNIANVLLPWASLKDYIKSRVVSLIAVNKPRPELDIAVREELTDYFKADIQQLETLINEDLSAWYTTPV